MNIAIFSGPYRIGEQMGGIGLRLWELAQTLAGAGHAVTLVTPAACEFTVPGVQTVIWDEAGWCDVVDAVDAVVTTDLPDARVVLYAHRAGRLLVTENAVPIEHLAYDKVRRAEDPDQAYADLRDAYLLQTWLTDHFLVRSPVERATTIAVLAAAGRLTYAHYATGADLPTLISSLPVGFTAAAQAAADTATATVEETELVWSGGIWDYLDTSALLHALALLRAEGMPVRVRFCYPPPAGQRVDEAARLLRLRTQLHLEDQVILHPPGLAHTARDSVLAAARVLVVLGRPGIENDTCLRLRLRDALLYRLPVLLDDHGASGAWARETGCGLAVDTTDPQAVAAGIRRLLTDTASYRSCVDALTTRRPAHRYETTLAPLLGFLARGRPAVDAGSARQAAAVDSLLARHPALTRRTAPPI